MTFRAFLSRDGQTVMMVTERRRDVIQVEGLEAKRAFYRRMWGRKAVKPGEPGPYAKHYEATCQALDAVADQIKRGKVDAQANKG